MNADIVLKRFSTSNDLHTRDPLHRQRFPEQTPATNPESSVGVDVSHDSLSDIPIITSSRRKKQRLALILKKLRGFMLSERPYRNNQLRLNELSSALGVRCSDLSQTINDNYTVGFSSLVNSYRVFEAITVLSQRKHDIEEKNILDIAFEVGFNSKSSFYRVFKNETGLTPLQFRRICHSTPVINITDKMRHTLKLLVVEHFGEAPESSVAAV